MDSQALVSGALLAQVLLVAILFGGAIIMLSSQSRHSWKRDGQPSYSAFAWVILLLLLVSVGALVFTSTMSSVWAPLFQGSTFGGLSPDTALMIVFALNIVVVTYLIYATGGSLGSPFQPVLFLIPTLSLLLREPTFRVVMYALVISVVFCSMMQFVMPPLQHMQARLRLAHGFVSVSCLGLAVLIGVLTRPNT